MKLHIDMVRGRATEYMITYEQVTVVDKLSEITLAISYLERQKDKFMEQMRKQDEYAKTYYGIKEK